MFEEKIISVTKDEKTGIVSDSLGTRYERLRSQDVDNLYEMLKGDKDSQLIAEIYEKKVPKILFDVEKAIFNKDAGINVY